MEAFLPELHRSFCGDWPLDAYRAYLTELLDHPWARGSIRFLVLRDEPGGFLSFLRLHAVQALHHDREIWLAGIATVVTRERLRGQGYASELLRLTLDLLRQEGADGAYLFSDIGPDFYQRFGFVTVGSTMIDVPLASVPSSPDESIRVRALEPTDWTAVRRIHDSAGSGQPLWLVRDERQWDFLLSRWLRRAVHFPGDETALIGRVAVRGNVVVGYALGRLRAGTLGLLDYCTESPAEALVDPLLGSLKAEAGARGCTRLVSPWPPGIWGRPFERHFAPVPLPDGVFMVASLSPRLDLPRVVEQVRGYWEMDHI